MEANEDGRRFSLRVKRVGAMPIVALRLWLRAGTRLEEIPGQSLLAGRLLAEGSRDRTWDQIARDAEDLGMVLQSFGTHDTIGISIDALAEDWSAAVDTLAELTLEPSFPMDRHEWLRRQAAGELDSLLDQPEIKTGHAFLEHLYRPHPYGRALQGDAYNLKVITGADCASFHGRALEWGGVVVATGQIDADAMRRRLEELFGRLEGAATGMPKVEPPPGIDEKRREIVAGEGDQAHIYAGHLTIPRRHPDTSALSIIAVVLGASAGMSGRLPDRIREKEGLAYHVDVATYSGAGFDPGRLVTYVGTSPDTVDAAERAIREELQRLVEFGIDEQEFEEARSYLIGRDPFRRETARQWADIVAEAEFYGLQTDDVEWLMRRLRGLERHEVESAARRWIRPDDLKVTVGLPK